MARKRTKPTQKEQILRYLNDFGSITRIQSFADLGVCELSSRIGELEDMGFEFDRKKLTLKNRYGVNITVTEYSLKEDK